MYVYATIISLYARTLNLPSLLPRRGGREGGGGCGCLLNRTFACSNIIFVYCIIEYLQCKCHATGVTEYEGMRDGRRNGRNEVVDRLSR